ncbi:hypothetical protein VD0002_g9540 [Verticillium dahliae]|uniref:Homocysteine S-methyltransferase n=2 Tax=Verticillium dahliae TaxID=27337 RepID=G2WXF0_VERDV|nr:homocysteine S-methyltransferase [Verticillium dahliae VdLs.17]KAF3351380.1 hypothetical protein VdG2_00887 [Verticillium dahliae VDG2]KAH6707404.1 homocysteine S-methyltransferase [Verticillium dahliae]EGY21405.1 homocysteine S-methyltransferase [Verticillium dahliae VdLs.17]PNH30401.1 hypothetical protein BJF96_g6435 [Verticillium dahliae]PNH43447.1 hypothetical protein VD0004_g4063 [Verticillium dahliae]
MSSSPSNEVLILDGGLGTSLGDKYGVRFDKSTPLWSSHMLVSDQDTLLACQKDFGDVPVDIILTATYQFSIHGFANTRTAHFPDGIDRTKIASYARDAIAIAHSAGKANGGQVALSVGPYGACMIPGQEYTGKYDPEHDTPEDLAAWHLERFRIFEEAGGFSSPVSYVAVETMPRLDEIVAARKALDDLGAKAANTPFWIACVFPGEEMALPDGASISSAVDAMLNPAVARSQPWGIGINCTKVWKLKELIARFEAAVADQVQAGHVNEAPALVLYPDGTDGEVYNTTTQTWELPAGGKVQGAPWEEQLAEIVRDANTRGKWKQIVVGGCCKASHAHLARLRDYVLNGNEQAKNE